MSKQKILLLGATGQTGSDILKGLLEDPNLEVTCLIQPSSANKPAVLKLEKRGIGLITVDLSSPVPEIASAIKEYDTVISAIGGYHQALQLPLVDAAAAAGIRRFVPCAFMTVCPPGGIMVLRDDKQRVYERIWSHHLPYTIIDVGYWHQISVPRVPSGKLDAALLMSRNDEIFGKGEAKTALIDKRDIGKFVAKIVTDERTMNRFVFAYSDVLTQKEIVNVVERKSGEKVDLKYTTEEDLISRCDQARAEAAKHPTDSVKRMRPALDEYNLSTYVRKDNTPENAKYLGYLDAKELYPDIKLTSFESLVGELIEGKGKKPYAK